MRCFGCGGEFREMDGPTHPYVLSSAGCWAAYGELLALEYEDRSYAVVNRLSVDTYAVQHPGIDTAQARNSVGIHLSRLCLILELGWPAGKANDTMQIIAAKKFRFPWLSPPAGFGVLTVQNVLEAEGAVEHLAAVQLWAKLVWQAWAEHHLAVRGWLRELGWVVFVKSGKQDHFAHRGFECYRDFSPTTVGHPPVDETLIWDCRRRGSSGLLCSAG